jgi:hypothetical protein
LVSKSLVFKLGPFFHAGIWRKKRLVSITSGRTHIALLYVKLPTAQWWCLLILLKCRTQKEHQKCIFSTSQNYISDRSTVILHGIWTPVKPSNLISHTTAFRTTSYFDFNFKCWSLNCSTIWNWCWNSSIKFGFLKVTLFSKPQSVIFLLTN